MTPVISVIIPLYNKETIIEKCIKSVLNQSFDCFELIIIDDGSTDNSAFIAKNINDKRINFIKQENGGPSKARNHGIQASNAEWCVCLDADDELLPNALEEMYRLHQEHPTADIINCSTIIRKRDKDFLIRQKKEGFIKNNFKYWFQGGLMPGTGHSLFRTKLLKKHLYNERLRRFEDADLLFRLLNDAKLYNSSNITFIVNTAYSSASNRRECIEEDFVGHLSMKGKSFWEKLCVYKFFLEERDNYPKEMRNLYANWYKRYDLFLLHKLLK